MKQILQNLGSGETLLAEVPAPQECRRGLIVQTTRSLVSLGTEKMLIDFGRGGWIAKARSQPDKVNQVLQKIKTDGLWTTIDAVKAKLDTPIPLGYCNVGRALQVAGASSIRVGDRVASNGHHAEVVAVPNHLAAKIPDAVSDEEAAFTVVGAIGLQGIRLVQPTLGERIVVSGLGLIGLLAVQMLKANGCQVLGIDFDPRKLALAQSFGAEVCDLSAGQDPIAVAEHWTNGVGVDAVLITASTKSDELIHQAATMCRQRGRIVLVGVIGLNLQRADFYEKELTFQVSCSYGPGRYDPNYESRGLDYPIGFVRWTEQRNFEAVLQLMADGKLNVRPLITHRFPFDNALAAYQAINDPGAMGIVLEYLGEGLGDGCGVLGDGRSGRGDESLSRSGQGHESLSRSGQGHESLSRSGQGDESLSRSGQGNESLPRSGQGNESLPCSGRGNESLSRSGRGNESLSRSGRGNESLPRYAALGDNRRLIPALGRDVGVAFIGAGGFTTRMLMPLLPSGVRKQTVVSGSGVSAAYAARKFGFQKTASDYHSVLQDSAVDAVFITTPHNLHASMVCDALEAGKHVFVEKPLALKQEELANIQAIVKARPDQCLMVGFNRRFSPHMTALKEWSAAAPANKAIIITVNAGAIPADHWTQDPAVGGGRIVGEACHFIDLARFLIGSPIINAESFPLEGGDGRLGDCVALQLQFADGSLATIHYLANGNKDFPKERIEMFAGGKVLVCDNFRISREIGGKRKLKTSKQDKGHAAELAAFCNAIRNGGQWPITASELFEVSDVSIG